MIYKKNIKGTKTFDSGPSFIEEWHNYTLNILSHSFFENSPQNQIQEIKSNSLMNFNCSQMQINFTKGKKIKAVKYYFVTIFSISLV
jgi:hypothetical protein